MKKYNFKQVDVFSSVPLGGNPLAVVMDAEGLSDSQMKKIASWTNLSETTFVQPPSDLRADYQVKIYSYSGELPFAGHPTLGTAHVLLESGLKTKQPGKIVQQCGVGNVTVTIAEDGLLAFEAPKPIITPLPTSEYSLLSVVAGEDVSAFIGCPSVVDMGIRWLMVEVSSAPLCLRLQPNATALADLQKRSRVEGVAFFGRYLPSPDPAHFEIRTFLADRGSLVEDPVTGSANACLAWLLLESGNPKVTEGFKVRQGTCKDREGCIYVDYKLSVPWIGGYATTVIEGQITL